MLDGVGADDAREVTVPVATGRDAVLEGTAVLDAEEVEATETDETDAMDRDASGDAEMRDAMD